MSNKKIDVVMGAITSIVCVLVIGEPVTSQGSKLDLLEQHLKKNNDENFKCYNQKTKKYLKISRISYDLWKDRVFKKAAINSDIAEIKKITLEISKNLTSEFTNLKNQISKFLIDDGCIYTEPIAYVCAICSMLHLAVDYCELRQRQVAEYSTEWNTFQRINPKQFFQNVKNIYEGLPMPDGLDVMDCENIINAMDALAEKILFQYKKYFCVS